jgi:hypothetical protein
MRAICEHFGAASDDKKEKCGVSNANFTFLIATVPDPEATHLAIYFDRALESLTAAAGDVGYTFDRYWLPWSVEPEPNLLLLDDQERRREEQRKKSQQPGVLVFRGKKEGPQSALVIFLVGETPTSGINAPAFQNALSYMRSLGSNTEELRVSGPTFSGSFRSLARALKLAKCDPSIVTIRVVSQSASNAEASDDFVAETKAIGVEYHPVVENGERAARLFSNYLQSQWPGARHIAILNEDVTVFGSLVAKATQDGSEWITVRYPWEISHLRNSSEDPTAPAPPSGSQQAAAPRVPLTLKDSESGKDNVPVFSKQQGAASDEGVLLSIAHTLRNERVDNVGIVATDTLDAVFLSRFLRSACPEIRIFVFEPDVLFIRAAETAPLVGTLAVTTYPLISRNQYWTGAAALPRGGAANGRRVLFPSRHAEGVYNAASALLTDNKYLLEYARPIGAPGNHPPLWLTAVGSDGYWPISLLDDNERGGKTSLLMAQSPPGAFQPEPPSASWFIAFACITALALLHCIYVSFLLASAGRGQSQPAIQPKANVAAAGAQSGGSVSDTSRPPSSAPPPRVTPFENVLPAFGGVRRDLMAALGRLFRFYPSNGDPKACYPLLLETLTLAAVVVWLLAPLCRFWLPLGTGGTWAAAYGAVATFAVIWLLQVAYALTTAEKGENRWPTLLAWLCVAACSAVAIFLIFARGYQAGMFFAYRALHFGSGLCPLVPLLLLAPASWMWAWVLMRRTREMQSWKDRSLPPIQEPGKRAERVDACLRDFTGEGRGWLAVGAVALWFLLFQPWTNLQSIDHFSYDFLYLALVALLYGTVSLALFEFMATWRYFRAFLHSLERHIIRNAFSRMPKEITGLPLLSSSDKPQLFISSRASDSLQMLISSMKESFHSLDVPLMAKLDDEGRKIDTSLMSLNKQYAESGEIDMGEYQRLQTALVNAADILAEDLAEHEWLRGDSDSLQHELEDEQEPLQAEDKERILKEEIVGLRYLVYIRHVFRPLKDLLWLMVTGFVLSVASLHSYPFRGHRMIGLASVVILLLIGVGIGIVFAEMERDPILSRITETKANELGKNFYWRIVQFGALPLLTVFASQFPSLGRFIFSWLEPALEALH